jgi:hypothetical protein
MNPLAALGRSIAVLFRRGGVDFQQATLGDLEAGQIVGGDVHGIPSGQLLPLIADMLANEAQWRRADVAAREIRQQDIDRQFEKVMMEQAATNARLDRYAALLLVGGGVLLVQTLMLIVGVVIVVSLLWPRLIAFGVLLWSLL